MSNIPPPPGSPPPPPPGFPPGGGAGAQLGPLASWGQRVGAYLVSMAMLFAAFIVVAIVGAIFGAIADALGVLIGLIGYLGVMVGSFYFFYLDGETGGHPGKRLMGLKTVDANTGQLIGGGKGVVRFLAHYIDGLICYIGFLFPLWDAKNQTIADKVMSTVVLADQPKMAFGPELFKK